MMTFPDNGRPASVSRENHAPLRILFLSKNTSLGGSMRVLSYVLKYLDKQRFAPTVIARDGGDLLPEYRRYAPTYVYGEDKRHLLLTSLERSFAGALKRVIAKKEKRHGRRWLQAMMGRIRPHLIVHNYHAAIPLFDGVPKGDVPAIQIVSMYGAALNSLGSAQIEKFVDRATHFICQGKNVREFAHDCLGIPLGRISTVCVGVDLAVPDHQLGKAKRVQRSDLGISEKDLVIATCGPLNYHKAPDIWLKAAALLQARRNQQPLKFIWIGGTERQLAGLYGRSVLRLRGELGLDPYVVITGYQQEVYPYLDLCDIYVQPSRDDAFPHAILEAMALGKPAVSFRQGVAAEDYAKDALVCVGVVSPEALAAGIADLMDHPLRRQTLGAAGRRLIETRFEAAATVRAYQDVLTTVIEKSGQGRHFGKAKTPRALKRPSAAPGA
ncbi:MAG: glycosyltransferase family 4 protein [Desulfobacteraceae bacterium]|jgi:glycosyltransferase involved in cell wall biosynthesis